MWDLEKPELQRTVVVVAAIAFVLGFDVLRLEWTLFAVRSVPWLGLTLPLVVVVFVVVAMVEHAVEAVGYFPSCQAFAD